MNNEQIIWNYFKDKGFTDCGVASLMGNLYAESALNPTNLQNSSEKRLGMTDAQYTDAVDNGKYTNFVRDSAGYGLAQWTYWSRKQKLYDFCKEKNKSIGDLNTQLDFLYLELTTSYPSLVKILKSTNNIQEGSNAVLFQFEQPADQGASVQAKRASYGQIYYNKYGGNAMSSAVDRVIATATAEIGYLEKKSNSQLDSKTANAGDNNYTKYARDLDAKGNIYNGKKQGYAWCDVFVDWCFITTFGADLGMKLLCQPYNGAGAGCTYSAQYYKNKGQFHKANPQPGDQIFFTQDGGKTSCHTGLVTKVSSSLVYTIEGNTSSTAGVVSNGGCVREKSYSLTSSYIYGYGRPDWSIIPGANTTITSKDITPYQGKTTSSLNCRNAPNTSSSIIKTYPQGAIVTISKENGTWGYTGIGWVSLSYIQKITVEDDEDMTQEKFNEMMDNYWKQKASEKATWGQENLDWAVQQGILQGSEQGLMPNKFCSRLEVVTMLQRVANKLGLK